MTLLKKLLWLILLSMIVSANAIASDSFVVQGIKVEGAQGISRQTILNYVPIHVGETLDTAKTVEIIRDLYQTGFFENVTLSRQGNILIIDVVGRPVIGSIKVTGNSAITKDQINSVFSNVGLVEGRVFDQSVLDKVTTSLQTEYYSVGKYNAKVTTVVTPEPRNRVAVLITVSEGRVALVQNVQIIGNHAFSESTLRNVVTLTNPRWNSFFTHNDQYTKDKLDASTTALTNYYLDRGYLNFKIDSAQATLAPDRKSVYLIIHVTEGPVYTVKGFDIVGNTILPKSQLVNMVMFKAGDVFSRQELQDSVKLMSRALGNQGYAFADINTIPDVDNVTKQVFITFDITPGNRIYVRRINFKGNTKTSDDVLRRAMRVQEGGLINVDNVDESTRQLNLLGYLSNIKEQTVPVPGSQNLVDVNYNVTETSSASATAGVGYGTLGWVINAGINQSNFLGTGDSVGINFNTDLYERTYSLTFNNPYFTPNGVSAGFSAYDTQVTPGSVNLPEYFMNNYGFNLVYGIPLTETSSYQLGIGLQHTTLHPGNNVPTVFTAFTKANGTQFNQLLLSAGWSSDTLDRLVFPTSGLNQQAALQVSTPIAGTPLDYYKITYQAHWFRPITDGFIFTAEGGAGYGNGYGPTQALPFFENYYAGGIGFNGAVRGYETNTLGPLDSNGQPVGGNAMLAGSLGLIVPIPLAPDSLRTTIFVDSGNVYNTHTAYTQKSTGIQLGQLAYSTGVEVDWQVPVVNALVTLSLAKAIDPPKNYQPEFFQFNIGTSF